jgi:NAD(P)H-hydrate repair Nnr-like enzyme with NAD(P)H-hydrate epimerase domain
MPVPVISIAQTHEWEKATWTSGQTEAEVIRCVGLALSKHALQLTRPGDLILILAGAGHNGEDARSAREHLQDRRVDLLDTRNPETDFSRLSALLSLKPALIIDGLFGIGINRPLDSAWKRFIDTINSSRAKVLAVDIPSGLDADSGNPQGAAIRASVTMTVGAPKKGAARFGRMALCRPIGSGCGRRLDPLPCCKRMGMDAAGGFRGIPARPLRGRT